MHGNNEFYVFTLCKDGITNDFALYGGVTLIIFSKSTLVRFLKLLYFQHSFTYRLINFENNDAIWLLNGVSIFNFLVDIYTDNYNDGTGFSKCYCHSVLKKLHI